MAGMTGDSLLRLENLRKSYGSFTLHIPELAVRAGEILGLLGPTGAGKSTLLRLLAGLASADQGKIFCESKPFASDGLDLHTRRRLTMVHQHPLLLTGTVRFNVEYGLRLRGHPQREDKVDAILDRLGLSKFAPQSARTLSGGQTQLVALARALVIEPEILLLDEPTAHLDPAHVALIEDTIRQVQEERPMTVVWATHNLFQAHRVATRAALLLDGQLVETTPIDEFFLSPSDPRTADFVQGRMVY